MRISAPARAALRRIGASGLLFGTAVVGLQLVPLAGVLGYEYSVAVAALVAVFGPTQLLWGAPTPGCDRPLARFMGNMRRLGLMVSFTLVIGAVQALVGTNCDPWEGVLYFAIFAGGSIPWVAGVCVAVQAAVHTPWRRLVLAHALLLLSVARAIWWLYSEPAIQVYEPFVGWFAGSIYDEALSSMLPHVLYRVWTTALATLVVLVLDGVTTPRRFRLRWIALSLVVVVSIWSARGTLGLERSRGWIQAHLGGHVQTAHFDIYFDAATTSDEQLRQLVYDHEARYRELRAFFNTEPTSRLSSFVYASREQKGQMMGGRNTLVAKIWLSEMHIVWDAPGDSMLAHEMAHLFLRGDGSGPLMLSSRWRLLPVMAMVEGAAGAAEWSSRDLDEHAWSAAMLRLDLGESIAELLGPTGFWGAPSGRAYTLTSSFSRWLVSEYGADRFRQAYGDGAFAEVYGVPLAELESRWRAFLAEYPLEPDMLALAEYRFDRPTLFGRRCARQAATRLAEGDAFMRRRQHEDARRCYDALLRFDPDNAGYRLTVAGRLREMGELMRAEEIARSIAVEPGYGRVRVAQAEELLADILWERGQAESAAVVYAELLQTAFAHTERRRLLAKQWGASRAGERPELSRLLRDVFASSEGGDSNHAAAMVDAWHVTHEPWTAYLGGLWLSVSEPELAARMLAQPEIEALPVEVRLRAQQSLASVLWQSDDWEGACSAWARVAELAAAGSEAEAESRVWRGRCAASLRPPATLTNLEEYGSDAAP